MTTDKIDLTAEQAERIVLGKSTFVLVANHYHEDEPETFVELDKDDAEDCDFFDEQVNDREYQLWFS